MRTNPVVASHNQKNLTLYFLCVEGILAMFRRRHWFRSHCRPSGSVRCFYDDRDRKVHGLTPNLVLLLLPWILDASRWLSLLGGIWQAAN